MSHLDRIWTGITTRTAEDSGTDDAIEIVINENGIDRLRRTIGDTEQDDLEDGGANLYTMDVAANNIVPENLTNSSIRVGLKGGDAWRPEDIFMWGRRLTGGAVIPLALETNITTQLSTEAGEGASSMPLRRVALGARTMQINRLFMLMTTSTSDDAGTDNTITLQITTTGLVVDFDSEDTSQEDLETSQANFYEVPVITSFSKASIAMIRLEINGNDGWLPSSFFLFGVDDAEGRPEFVVPLVHLPSWAFGWMSTDSSEGVTRVQLPLAPTP
jgi:hypothetical protein